jgi:hypothetical protein
MKKILMIAGLGLFYMTAGAKDIQGTYNGMDIGPDGVIHIKCKKSKYVCVRISNVTGGSAGWDAMVLTPDGEPVFHQACSDFYELDLSETDIEVTLLP